MFLEWESGGIVAAKVHRVGLDTAPIPPRTEADPVLIPKNRAFIGKGQRAGWRSYKGSREGAPSGETHTLIDDDEYDLLYQYYYGDALADAEVGDTSASETCRVGGCVNQLDWQGAGSGETRTMDAFGPRGARQKLPLDQFPRHGLLLRRYTVSWYSPSPDALVGRDVADGATRRQHQQDFDLNAPEYLQ
ncbi:hypothetical protein GGTG_05557 [Gaeumannomyces tritici R3-111a-1]|uniref:Uncharacterized protein n=1 Tax=Gaeumannomyces tritici (strain R3-111a-1) TaxID=644352 RepID=J3NW92_GAET3|nr:hypothetical protein GGTG_05557 [Gaeumannomyces tritici R3-111a-1]EJT75624.1 hypothetical protein GGTG_05557 [Gaeumannomyces tritici R3-111a-1]